MSPSDVGSTPTDTQAVSAQWPPPGLELVHGKLWPVLVVLGFGGLIVGLPLLATLGTAAPFWSLGPFGDVWWLPLAATLTGGLVLLAGLAQLVRLARHAGAAASFGHGWRTIVYAAADQARDTGFLLQRARGYATIGPARRDAMLTLRLWAATLVLAAVLLAPLGLGAAVTLGRLGWVGEGFLWITAGILPLALLAVGTLCLVADGLASRAARRGAGPDRATQTETASRVAEWNRTLAAAPGAAALGATGRSGAFRVGAAVVMVLAIVVVVPVAVLVLVGGVVQVLAAVASPEFGRTQARLAAAEALRRYRVETNPAISPAAAGEALHDVLGVGRDSASFKGLERVPAHVYRDPWWPADPVRDSLLGRTRQVERLFGRARALSAAERRYLDRVAAHPAREEFRLVAAAPSADVITTRYHLPFADTVNSWILPLPAYNGIRDGARAHLARAVLDLGQGQAERAERAVREVIGAGFLLLDHGPTLIDNLVGAAVVTQGADALEALYRATGRTREAETLGWARTEVRRAAERMAPGVGLGGIETALRTTSRVVVDTAAAPGLRWEFFGMVTAFAPCVSLNRLVFGPGTSYRRWGDSARAVLVRGPGDEQLFELYRRGPFGAGHCLPPLETLRMVGPIQ